MSNAPTKAINNAERLNASAVKTELAYQAELQVLRQVESEAKKIIGDLFDKYYTSESEVVSLGDSYNRVLFTDIESKIDFPPFNRALKDGYAVKVEDTYGASEESPKTVKVIDIVEAGDFCDKPLNLGECVQISTGAPMPEDAEAVEMV